MKKSFVILSLFLMLSTSAPAQILDGAFVREDAPLLPALGNWWTPDAGPGRWGLQIEVQTGTFFPLGFLGAAIFTYDNNDTSIPTWYSIAQPYVYNANWRQDGYIGQMQLTLSQNTNGTCLLCPDGQNAGAPMTPDVTNATIIFRDSMNAELVVGGITHDLVKSQYGDGPKGYLNEYWRQTFGFVVEATYPDTRINGISSIRPTQATQQVSYEGVSGWDAFTFTSTVAIEIVSTGQTGFALQGFQLLSHRENNQYRLIFPSLTASSRLEYKLFPQSRFLIEGRLINHVGFQNNATVRSNVMFIATPSMQPTGGTNRPWF